MPFLLNREDRPDGHTQLTYDLSPTERVNVLVPLSNAHITEMVPASELLNTLLSTIRAPRTRR